MLRQFKPGTYKWSHIRSASTYQYNWPPALPVVTPPHCPSRNKFYEEFGQHVNYAALYDSVSRTGFHENLPTAPHLLKIYASKSTTRTLALALPLDYSLASSDPAEAYYQYIGQLTEKYGLAEAIEFVKKLHSPFLTSLTKSNPMRQTTDKGEKALENSPATAQAKSQENELNWKADEENKQLGPIELSESDGMNLFDPESWLTESPTAQKIWKESKP